MKVKTYVNKPNPEMVEAVRFDGSNKFEMVEFVRHLRFSAYLDKDHIELLLDQDTLNIYPGDYLVRWADGKVAVSKPEVFRAQWSESEGCPMDFSTWR